jgi:hypothetical protein
MDTLNLGGKQLPASRFPERADAYYCDECLMDITEHLHPGRAHVRRDIGKTRYKCVCGRVYMTGAVEWDQLEARERRSRLVEMLGIGFVTTSLILVLAVLLSHAIFKRSIVFAALAGTVALPSVILLIMCAITAPELIEIGLSLWRTRLHKKK